MWSEAAFQVGPNDIDDLIDDELAVLQGFPGIDAIRIDSGRHLVFIRHDTRRWSPLQLAEFLDELGWTWQPVPAPAA
jgi:hypothetical protein